VSDFYSFFIVFMKATLIKIIDASFVDTTIKIQ